jgi:hypothetical protein
LTESLTHPLRRPQGTTRVSINPLHHHRRTFTQQTRWALLRSWTWALAAGRTDGQSTTREMTRLPRPSSMHKNTSLALDKSSITTRQRSDSLFAAWLVCFLTKIQAGLASQGVDEYLCNLNFLTQLVTSSLFNRGIKYFREHPGLYALSAPLYGQVQILSTRVTCFTFTWSMSGEAPRPILGWPPGGLHTFDLLFC